MDIFGSRTAMRKRSLKGKAFGDLFLLPPKLKIMSWDQMTNANTSQLLLVELSGPSSIVADERIFVALVDFLD